MSRYDHIDALKHNHALTLDAYRITETFPKREWFGLPSQIRKAAVSACLNIVEGSVKRGAVEFRKYLDTAWGSLNEAGYAMRIAHDLGYVSDADWKDFHTRWTEACKLTWKLYAAIARQADRASGRTAA